MTEANIHALPYCWGSPFSNIVLECGWYNPALHNNLKLKLFRAIEEAQINHPKPEMLEETNANCNLLYIDLYQVASWAPLLKSGPAVTISLDEPIQTGATWLSVQKKLCRRNLSLCLHCHIKEHSEVVTQIGKHQGPVKQGATLQGHICLA